MANHDSPGARSLDYRLGKLEVGQAEISASMRALIEKIEHGDRELAQYVKFMEREAKLASAAADMLIKTLVDRFTEKETQHETEMREEAKARFFNDDRIQKQLTGEDGQGGLLKEQRDLREDFRVFKGRLAIWGVLGAAVLTGAGGAIGAAIANAVVHHR